MITGLDDQASVDRAFEAGATDYVTKPILYIFSDGAYEIHQPDGKIWGLNAFMDFLVDYKKNNINNLDKVLEHLHSLNANKALDDDFSLLQIEFNCH